MNPNKNLYIKKKFSQIGFTPLFLVYFFYVIENNLSYYENKLSH